MSGKHINGGWKNSPVRSLCPRPCDLCIAAPPTWSESLREHWVQLSNPQGCRERWEVKFHCCTQIIFAEPVKCVEKMQRKSRNIKKIISYVKYCNLCCSWQNKTSAYFFQDSKCKQISKRILSSASILIVIIMAPLCRLPRMHWASCSVWCRCGSVHRVIWCPSASCMLQSASEYCEETASARYEECHVLTSPINVSVFEAEGATISCDVRL